MGLGCTDLGEAHEDAVQLANFPMRVTLPAADLAAIPIERRSHYSTPAEASREAP